jgi:hypothetical protein
MAATESPPKEEPTLNFYEDMDIPVAKKNAFSAPSDESDNEITDAELNKLLIVTQPYTPGTRNKKHEGYDRTGSGSYSSRVKMSQDMAQAINDGLYFYEEDLWGESDEEWEEPKERKRQSNSISLVSQEDFDKLLNTTEDKPVMMEIDITPKAVAATEAKVTSTQDKVASKPNLAEKLVDQKEVIPTKEQPALISDEKSQTISKSPVKHKVV